MLALFALILPLSVAPVVVISVAAVVVDVGTAAVVVKVRSNPLVVHEVLTPFTLK